MKLVFTQYAFEKLRILKGAVGGSELSVYGITSKTDHFLVEDLLMIKQTATSATFEIDDKDTAKEQYRLMKKGYEPFQFSRIWIHTHPGTSKPSPSHTDEECFETSFGKHEHAVMVIFSSDLHEYFARLKCNFKGFPVTTAILDIEVQRIQIPQKTIDKWIDVAKAKTEKAKPTYVFNQLYGSEHHSKYNRYSRYSPYFDDKEDGAEEASTNPNSSAVKDKDDDKKEENKDTEHKVQVHCMCCGIVLGKEDVKENIEACDYCDFPFTVTCIRCKAIIPDAYKCANCDLEFEHKPMCPACGLYLDKKGEEVSKCKCGLYFGHTCTNCGNITTLYDELCTYCGAPVAVSTAVCDFDLKDVFAVGENETATYTGSSKKDYFFKFEGNAYVTYVEPVSLDDITYCVGPINKLVGKALHSDTNLPLPLEDLLTSLESYGQAIRRVTDIEENMSMLRALESMYEKELEKKEKEEPKEDYTNAFYE